jgi:APA family basic amino acid/polyamine antiporter
VVTVLLFLSVLGYVNVLLMSNPRVMAAMSDDKILPKAFGKRNIKNDVLTTSLSIFSAICILIIFIAKEFDTILSFTIFLDCFGMVLSAGSIFKIRNNTSHLNNSGIYMIKFYPWLPIIFIAAYSFVGIILLITETKISLIGLSVLAAFIIIYFLVFLVKKRKSNI